MTLVRRARAIPASKLSLEQDNKESVHLVGVVAPAIVYRVCVCVCVSTVVSHQLNHSCRLARCLRHVCRCCGHAKPSGSMT